MTRQETFFEKYQYAFILASLGTTIFPSVKAAQAALESDYGKRPTKGNNMFGIKARGVFTPYWKGESTTDTTREVDGGKNKIISDDFRKYETLQDSIKDHTYFLQINPRYKPVFEATTPEAQCNALQTAGYATDPNYASSLIWIINKYNLKDLDKKKR